MSKLPQCELDPEELPVYLLSIFHRGVPALTDVTLSQQTGQNTKYWQQTLLVPLGKHHWWKFKTVQTLRGEIWQDLEKFYIHVPFVRGIYF